VKYPARALIGFMPRDEALQLLAGGPVSTSETKHFEQLWRQYAEAAQADRKFTEVTPLEEIPDEISARLEAFASRPDVGGLMQPHDWSVGFADVSKNVLSYQRVVIVKDVDARIGNVSGRDLGSLVDICLPPPQTSQMLGAFDQAQLAFTTSSVNPNLRIAGFDIANTPGAQPGQAQQILGFRITMGSTFVQLVEYKGRWMVRDGYHRLYGLLAKGITRIPCVVIRAKTFEETGAGRPGFFSFETLYGSQPPLVTDFLSDRIAADIQVQATMRVIRIKADEFFVPIHEIGPSG
jgi:hypothetical protein